LDCCYRAGRNSFQRGQQLRHQWASISKAIGTRAKNDECDAAISDTLLIRQPSVHCYENIETFFSTLD
jgi:hypothetical protein